MRLIRFHGTKAAMIALSFIAILALSCASMETRPEDVGKGRILDRRPLDDPPTYGQLAASLEYYETELGIKFYRNDKGRFQPYSTAGWQSFAIADDLDECLYDINMRDLVTYRSATGGTRSMIEMDIARGVCGIRYPDADSSAQDKVTLMEGSVISPAVEGQLDQVSMLRGASFLQKTLGLPWRINSLDGGLEQSVAKVGYEVKNPLDVTFGDVIFFTEYYGERNVGVYLDYGYFVYNSCFRAKVNKMNPSLNYRIYRIYTGPHAIQYKLHQSKFLQDIIGGPGR